MKSCSKLTTLAILTSFLGIQFSAIQPISAQEYKLVPPPQGQQIVDPNSNNFTTLPTIDTNQMYNPGTTLKGQVSTVPKGTAFEVITNTTVGSSINEVGDIFTATLSKPIVLGGNVVVPEGSEVIGQITFIDNAGRAGKNGVMDIKFTSIKLPYGPKVPINGKIITVDNSGALKGGSIKKQIVTSVGTGIVTTGGGALGGLAVGSLMGASGGGAVLGTTAGGIFGLGYIIARKGKEVVMPSDTKLNILLEQPLTVGR